MQLGEITIAQHGKANAKIKVTQIFKMEDRNIYTITEETHNSTW